MPITGTSTRLNISIPRPTSSSATSCGRGDNDTAVNGNRLGQSQLYVAGARRHVDNDEIELAPIDLEKELLQQLVDHKGHAR